jgi:gamma-glutamyltranspeptidase/glutathione hydrolase
MTATVESMFGSRLMVEGFMLNNELTDFSLIPRDADGRMVANRVQGGKRPMSSQTPSIVFDNNNRPALIIGSPGGSSIINYVTQTMINVLDWNMDMQSAISAPHVISRNGPALVEEGTDAENLILPLEALGHEVNAVTLMSGLHGIKLKYDENGRRALEGGADPRREGYIAQ